MADFLKAAFPEIAGGLLAILCAVIGAKIATSASRKQANKKELLETYAELFAAYYALVADERSEKNSVQFLVAVERVRLLCSAKADRIITELTPLFTADPLPLDEMSEYIRQLREAAREDLRHAGP